MFTFSAANQSIFRLSRAILSFVVLALGLSSSLHAEDLRYPPDVGVIDVVRDRGVDNTGKTDVTAQLNKIFADGHGPQVYFLPKGTYLVSGVVMGPDDNGKRKMIHGPWIIGESRTETIIKLKDNTWPTRKPEPGSSKKEKKARKQYWREQVVLHTGDNENTTFNRQIRNLTVNTGIGNGGAIGICFIASNSGQITDVDIVSSDGKGFVGLSMHAGENGPGQVRNVRISGFQTGIDNACPYMFPYTNVQIEGATTVGFYNRSPVAIERLTVNMAGPGPAIDNAKCQLTLIDSELNGAPGTTSPAIQSLVPYFLRNVTLKAFAKSVNDSGTGNGTIALDFTGMTSDQAQLQPVVATPPLPPMVPWENDFSKWANPHSYVDGNPADWREAWQKACDQPGATTLVIQKGNKHPFTGQVTLGKDIQRVIGIGGWSLTDKDDPQNALVIGDGSAKVVEIRDFRVCPNIIIRTDRTIILDCLSASQNITIEGAAIVHMSDTHGNIIVKNPKAKIYIRHYNHERKNLALDLGGATAWILGWKGENLGPRVNATKGAKLEMLGFQSYESGKDKFSLPAFVGTDAQFSIAGFYQGGTPYSVLISDTQAGIATEVSAKEVGNPLIYYHTK